MKHALILAVVSAFVGLNAPRAAAAEYQWSVLVDGAIARETKKPPRAFLWIPQKCQRVRAVVVAIQNMQEEQLFNHPAFRQTLSDLDMAIVWITPPMGSNNFRFDQGEDKVLQGLLDALAKESGYDELSTAPLVPLGHSASASWCWDVAAWKPQRTLAVLSLSGQWPYFGAAEFWDGRSVDTVPGLTTKGEFEIEANLESGWYAGLKNDFYKEHPAAAFTQVVEPGDGHFAASDEKVALIDLFLRKAVQYRVAKDGSLKSIDASKTGWRYEVWHADKAPEAPAAPVTQFTGKLDRSFWAFDEEMARAIEAFQSRQRNKKNTLIGYVQKDGLVPPKPDHLMQHLKFDPTDDTLTFKLTGGFFDTVPSAETKDGKPVGWQKMLANYAGALDAGTPIAHPTGQDGTLRIGSICGPVVQKSKDTFALRFNRIGMDNPKRCAAICFIMTFPGDGTYKRMVQQAELRFPLTNTKGQEQTIDFPAIEDTSSSANKPIQLHAKATSDLPVYYYVREGPAEVDDAGAITLLPIPPRAKFPVKVTVVAWQWGRSDEPRVQSATPVERAFSITK
ncbi:MAG: hypothetical protein QM770_21210 [Tepidisphaeraceae bacterium]